MFRGCIVCDLRFKRVRSSCLLLSGHVSCLRIKGHSSGSSQLLEWGLYSLNLLAEVSTRLLVIVGMFLKVGMRSDLSN